MTSTVLLDNEFGSIERTSLNDEVDLLNINHCLGDAAISLYGGQVLSWQPKNQQPIFWLSKKAEFKVGKAIRGGIPLCWPWFGPNIQAGENIGNHGFARQRNWQLGAVALTETEVKITLKLTGENEHDLWPDKYELTQELIFSDSFKQQLMINNLTEQPIMYSAALHSYFAVSHPNCVTVDSLSPVKFDDKINQKSSCQDNLMHCIGPIDRVYHSTKDQMIIDQHWQRKIIVSSSNCQQWVLWNPGKEIAESMPDIHQGGENEYVCLEAANTQWQTIPALGSISVGQEIRIEKI